MSRKYKLRYSLQVGGFDRSNLDTTKSQGLCDEILLCSYVQGADGSGSYCWVSSDGTTPHKRMAPYRQMHCLAILCKEISEDPEFGPGARQFCATIFETWRTVIMSSKTSGDKQ